MKSSYGIYQNIEFQEFVKTQYLVKRKTLREIKDEFGCSTNLLTKVINLMGIKKTNQNPGRRRKVRVNDDFFKEINSEESAYFLGLLYADGNVSKTDNRILIRLQEKDKDILDCLNKHIYVDNDRPLLYEERSVKYPKWQNNYAFIVMSSVMKSDLISLGCHPDKKQTLRFPDFNQVPHEYIRHFIRGFFDGDGNVYCPIVKEKYLVPTVRFFSNKILSNQLCEFLTSELGLKFSSFADKRTLSWTCRVTGKKNISIIYDYFYKDATVFLERKKNKFDEILNHNLF